MMQVAIEKTKILSNAKILLGIDDDAVDEVLKVFMDVAINKLLEERYPFDMSKTEKDLDGRFNSWIARATRSIYESQGQMNITQFSQNGVQITYSNMVEGIDRSLINTIIPMAGVPK